VCIYSMPLVERRLKNGIIVNIFYKIEMPATTVCTMQKVHTFNSFSYCIRWTSTTLISSSAPFLFGNFLLLDGVFKLSSSPGIDSKESIPPAYVACAGIRTIYGGLGTRVGIGLSYRPASARM
jgi:hypothetical protein